MTADIEMKCPFCGKRDVEYGLALCAGCHAEIRYDVAERLSGPPEDGRTLDRIQAKADRATRDAENASWPFGIFAMKRLKKAADEMQQFTDALVQRNNEAVDRRLKRGGTPSLVTFSRGDRDIDVSVDIPLNADAKVDFDVVLLGHNGKKRQVTIAVRDLTKLKMGPSIKLVEALPHVILKGVSAAEAEKARAELAAAGGSVEVH